MHFFYLENLNYKLVGKKETPYWITYIEQIS